tara:strand:- start:193 stop:843 length:651 start_codon:yes stop_codon:yes gene_type:complete
MVDYTTTFISTLLFSIYMFLLNENKLGEIEKYVVTVEGRMLLILLILLTLYRNIQVGLMIALAYIFTVMNDLSKNKVEGFDNYKCKKELEEVKEKLSNKNIAVSLQEVEEQFKNIFGNTEEKLEDDLEHITDKDEEVRKNRYSTNKNTGSLKNKLKMIDEIHKYVPKDDDIEEEATIDAEDTINAEDTIVSEETEHEDNTNLIEGFSNFTNHYSNY